MTSSGLCRCGKPALAHESACFDCWRDDELVRLEREVVEARKRITLLEGELRKAKGRAYARRFRELKSDKRNAYNREWMRQYRARQKGEERAA